MKQREQLVTTMVRVFREPVIVLTGVALLAALPSMGSNYSVYLATQILILALLSLSFNLLFGYGGLLSFGHAGFFGAGGYTFALLILKAKWGTVAALGASVAVAAVMGVILGIFCVRRSGIFFSMLTLALSQMLYAIAFKWYDFTGGDNGLQGLRVPSVAGLTLTDREVYFWFVLGMVALAAFILRRVAGSPFGAMLQGVRDNPLRAAFIGVNVTGWQLVTFTVSGAVAGLAGALWAGFQRFVSPDMLYWSTSSQVVLMAILGGSRTFWGPALGAGLLTVLHDVIQGYTNYWSIFVGGTLLVLVLFLPEGILGGLGRLIANQQRRATVEEKTEEVKQLGGVA